MGTKVSFSNITADYTSATFLNTALDTIEAQFDKCLYTDGTAPNSMNADFDLNSNDLLNGGTLNATDIVIGGTSLIAQVNAAAASAAAAATSETNAATSATNAAASYDAFDDRYLGSKASDPALDNDGDALAAGALYFNTTTETMKVYTGSAWGDISVPTNFLALTDTPSSLSGQALNYVRVNAGETALEFTASAATVGDGDYGDITVSGSGTVWTVDDGLAVTSANLTTPTITTNFTFSGSTITGLTGADLTLVTGTAGANGKLAGWNADGDVVDAGYSVIDDDTMATASATTIPTSESVKAYADSVAGSDSFASNIYHVRHQVASGTDGGTATGGGWRTRTINTEVTDDITATLSSNQITLPAGDYWCEIWASAIDVQGHKLRLRNVTAGSTVLVGFSNGTQTSSSLDEVGIIRGKFTIAGSQALEIQSYPINSTSTIGFGRALSTGEVEVYVDAVFWKIA